VIRRRRLGVLGALALLGLVLALVVTSGSGPRAGQGPTRPGATPGSPAKFVAPPAAESGIVSWQLAAPVSREGAVGNGNGSITLAGGIVGAASQTGVFNLDPLTGVLRQVGTLPVAVHDAAVAPLRGGALVVGGGAAVPGTSVQAVAASGAGSSVGSLARARADAVAVNVGRTDYVIGGYDGSSLEPDVLGTKDGSHFAVVGRLPVPVRYPAVAALGTTIYVFGGLDAAGRPVRAIQAIDLARRTTSVVGSLPIALAGAAAATLSGHIYLAGGATATGPLAAVDAYVPARHEMLHAGQLPVAVAYAGAATAGGRLWLVGGELAGGAQTANVEVVSPNRKFGTAGVAGAGSPYFGDKLLIADRGNDRLLLVSDTGTILWHYPSASRPAPSGGFYFPDDAFFLRHGSAIISNQEGNDTIVILSYPSGKVLWTYGHPRVSGSAPGYLNTPDDAYYLKNGDVSVADPYNCRVLIINPKTDVVVHQIGTTGACAHRPPTEMTAPNGDTPLANGDVLVSEIGGSWIDEYTPSGHVVWSVQLPTVSYVSDPQQLGPDRYLVADYASPGAFVEFNRAGQVLYRFGPTSGPGQLNYPSLVERLPSGVLMANDDHNDRIVAIDPTTNAEVWQYGVTGRGGTGPGYLFKPDGFDLLAPGGLTPTHPATG